MKLSELAYRCVKHCYFTDDISFTYSKFESQEAKLNPDYTMQINNVYSCINEAIARLSDMDKIPNRIASLDVNVDGYIDTSSLEHKVKEVINVAQGKPYDYKSLAFMPFGVEKIAISGGYNPMISCFVEYKEDIPYFDEDSYEYDTTASYVKFITKDVDLRKYGITDGMCNYIMEYAQGKLIEYGNETISNMHITRAEQYFDNLKSVQQTFPQQVVDCAFTIER